MLRVYGTPYVCYSNMYPTPDVHAILTIFYSQRSRDFDDFFGSVMRLPSLDIRPAGRLDTWWAWSLSHTLAPPHKKGGASKIKMFFF